MRTTSLVIINNENHKRNKRAIPILQQCLATECPKCVSISNIARLNREYLKAKLAD